MNLNENRLKSTKYFLISCELLFWTFWISTRIKSLCSLGFYCHFGTVFWVPNSELTKTRSFRLFFGDFAHWEALRLRRRVSTSKNEI